MNYTYLPPANMAKANPEYTAQKKAKRVAKIRGLGSKVKAYTKSREIAVNTFQLAADIKANILAYVTYYDKENNEYVSAEELLAGYEKNETWALALISILRLGGGPGGRSKPRKRLRKRDRKRKPFSNERMYELLWRREPTVKRVQAWVRNDYRLPFGAVLVTPDETRAYLWCSAMSQDAITAGRCDPTCLGSWLREIFMRLVRYIRFS